MHFRVLGGTQREHFALRARIVVNVAHTHEERRSHALYLQLDGLPRLRRASRRRFHRVVQQVGEQAAYIVLGERQLAGHGYARVYRHARVRRLAHLRVHDGADYRVAAIGKSERAAAHKIALHAAEQPQSLVVLLLFEQHAQRGKQIFDVVAYLTYTPHVLFGYAHEPEVVLRRSLFHEKRRVDVLRMDDEIHHVVREQNYRPQREIDEYDEPAVLRARDVEHLHAYAEHGYRGYRGCAHTAHLLLVVEAEHVDYHDIRKSHEREQPERHPVKVAARGVPYHDAYRLAQTDVHGERTRADAGVYHAHERTPVRSDHRIRREQHGIHHIHMVRHAAHTEYHVQQRGQQNERQPYAGHRNEHAQRIPPRPLEPDEQEGYAEALDRPRERKRQSERQIDIKRLEKFQHHAASSFCL